MFAVSQPGRTEEPLALLMVWYPVCVQALTEPTTECCPGHPRQLPSPLQSHCRLPVESAALDSPANRSPNACRCGEVSLQAQLHHKPLQLPVSHTFSSLLLSCHRLVQAYTGHFLLPQRPMRRNPDSSSGPPPCCLSTVLRPEISEPLTGC